MHWHGFAISIQQQIREQIFRAAPLFTQINTKINCIFDAQFYK
jgi:hypothetical protein